MYPVYLVGPLVDSVQGSVPPLVPEQAPTIAGAIIETATAMTKTRTEIRIRPRMLLPPHDAT